MTKLCETTVQHIHCWKEFPLGVKAIGDTPFECYNGGCGEPMTTLEEMSRGWCDKYCERKRREHYIHMPAQEYQNLQRTETIFTEESGTLGHSPFRRQLMTYAHGDTQVISQRESTKARWRARERGALVNRPEDALDWLNEEIERSASDPF